MDTENTQQNNEKKGGRTLRGTVVSEKGEKSAVVAVDRYVKHPKYKKFMRRTKRFLIHDEANECREGDAVTIVETKPTSKKKRFQFLKKNT